MVASLEKRNPIVLDEIDEPVLLSDPTRPEARIEMFEGFRLPDPLERIIQNLFHQPQNS